MGGFGSGRRGWRVTVEGCRSLKLDVNRITRGVRERWHGLHDDEIAESIPFLWTWTIRGEREPWARIVVMLTLHGEQGFARLVFDIDHETRRTGPQDQRVEMESTPCRFGGRRWWWICPATGRRCAKLYLPNGGTRFLSRTAYGLAYGCQRETHAARMQRRIGKLCCHLGGAWGVSVADLPDKPKWMRWATYRSIEARALGAQDVIDEDFVRWALRFVKLD